MNKIDVDFLTASVADLITYTNHECDRIEALWAAGREALTSEIEAGLSPLGGELQPISGQIHAGSTTFGTDQRLLAGYGGENACQDEGNRGLFSEVPRSPGPSSAFFCDEDYGTIQEHWDFLCGGEPFPSEQERIEGDLDQEFRDGCFSSGAERESGLPNQTGGESGGGPLCQRSGVACEPSGSPQFLWISCSYTDQAEFAAALKRETVIRRSGAGNGRTKADERRLAKTNAKLSASRATEFTSGRGGCPLGPFRPPGKRRRAEEKTGKIPLQPPPKKRKLTF